MNLILFIVFLFTIHLNADDYDTPIAKLLLFKSTNTNPVVEGMNFQILYQIINIGSTSAKRVEVADRYDPNSFEQVEGKFNDNGAISNYYEEIEPNDRVFFNVSVKPKLYGVYESTRARIKYASSVTYEENEDVKKGYSTSLGKIKILSKVEYKRRNKYPIIEWLVFALVIILAVGLPLHQWWISRKKNLEIMTVRKIK